MLLLTAIDAGALHGYAIAEELRRASAGRLDLQDGTIYPALRRLERAGWVSSTWDQDTGRRRRSYHLTPDGRSTLRDKRGDWTQFARVVTDVLDLRPQ